MRVLLPPSESKRPDGGNAVFNPESLLFHSELGPARERVAEALAVVSADSQRAAAVFKLGQRAQQEILHNLRFASASGLPAIERYTGVLFDEIELSTLSSDAREWINGHTLIQSALFGLLSASDNIPPYRLSASTRLTDELGLTLKKFWNGVFADFLWPATFVVDLRSKDYAALAPLPSTLRTAVVDIVQRTDDGTLRALNHFNKKAKGDLLKRLANSRPDITNVSEFVAWARSQGLDAELVRSASNGASARVLLISELGVNLPAQG